MSNSTERIQSRVHFVTHVKVEDLWQREGYGYNNSLLETNMRLSVHAADYEPSRKTGMIVNRAVSTALEQHSGSRGDT